VTGFSLRGKITEIETIAVGKAIRDLGAITKKWGKGKWRKLKGRALIELPSGKVVQAELHWYEAHGIGRQDMKLKRVLR
jgi:hypothetical protein